MSRFFAGFGSLAFILIFQSAFAQPAPVFEPELWEQLMFQAREARCSNDFQKSESLIRAAITEAKRAAGSDSKPVANCLHELIQLLIQEKEFKQALPVSKIYLMLSTKSFGKYPWRIAEAYRDVADIQYGLRNYKIAADSYHKASELIKITPVINPDTNFETSELEQHNLLVYCLEGAAKCYGKQGDKYNETKTKQECEPLHAWSGTVRP